MTGDYYGTDMQYNNFSELVLYKFYLKRHCESFYHCLWCWGSSNSYYLYSCNCIYVFIFLYYLRLSIVINLILIVKKSNQIGTIIIAPIKSEKNFFLLLPKLRSSNVRTWSIPTIYTYYNVLYYMKYDCVKITSTSFWNNMNMYINIICINQA